MAPEELDTPSVSDTPISSRRSRSCVMPTSRQFRYGGIQQEIRPQNLDTGAGRNVSLYPASGTGNIGQLEHRILSHKEVGGKTKR